MQDGRRARLRKSSQTLNVLDNISALAIDFVKTNNSTTLQDKDLLLASPSMKDSFQPLNWTSLSGSASKVNVCKPGGPIDDQRLDMPHSPIQPGEDFLAPPPSISSGFLRSTNSTSRGFWIVRHVPMWLWDPVALIVCIVVTVCANIAEPRYSFVPRELLSRVSYPVHSNTVPSWSVPLYALVAPLLLFIATKAVSGQSGRDCTRLCLALFFAVFLTGAVTNAIKSPMGRLRPNFVRHCWPDGKIVLEGEDAFGGYPVCSCDKGMDREIRKSFPSGHSSWSAAGLGFVSFWLLGQTRALSPTPNGFNGAPANDPNSASLTRTLLSLLPAFGAVAVGVTRVVDYWHHPTDVIVGLAIGFGFAYLAYRLEFPPLTSPYCNIPLSRIPGGHLARASGNADYETRSSNLTLTLPANAGGAQERCGYGVLGAEGHRRRTAPGGDTISDMDLIFPNERAINVHPPHLGFQGGADVRASPATSCSVPSEAAAVVAHAAYLSNADTAASAATPPNPFNPAAGLAAPLRSFGRALDLDLDPGLSTLHGEDTSLSGRASDARPAEGSFFGLMVGGDGTASSGIRRPLHSQAAAARTASSSSASYGGQVEQY